MNEQLEFELGIPTPDVRLVKVREHSRRLRYVRDSKTSRAAAEAMVQSADAARQRVYQCIANYGPICDRAIQAELAMPGDTQRPRRVELAEQGLIAKAGTITLDGRKQTLWKVT
jgi:hypothetical protein